MKIITKREKEKVKIPKSVQKTIPIKTIYEDGIFKLEDNKFSRTFKFTDVNYAVAGQEDKETMFLGYGAILNLLDSGSFPKLTIINRKLNKVDFDNKIKLQLEDDHLTKHRKEFNEILSKNSIDAKGMIQEKLLTIAIDKKNIGEARNYFNRTGTEIGNNFAKLNSKFTELDLNERLRIFYDFYRSGEEDLYNFDIKKFMKKGHCFKDYICPDTMEFKSDYFKMGEKFGRVLYLKEYASFIRDNIISELTELNKNMMLSVDIKPVPMEEAIKIAEKVRLGVETNITQWQKRQNANNNFSAVIPYDMERQREESKEFLDDLITRDQRMFLSVLTIVHLADSKEELDSDTESLLTTASKHLCQLSILKYQQLDGLNTVMPYGVRKINALRTLTTESLSVFMPFKVQEIQDSKGIYYGKNIISKNLIMIDRKELQNGNSFILGVSGSGKSFTAKQEITSIALRDKNADIIVIDPEAEYKPLIKSLGGEVIKISATSDNHINALDLNKNYGDKNPIIDKSEFVLSLCEQAIGGKAISSMQKSIIDRCTSLVYRYYAQGNYQGEPPTLEDFRKVLLEQSEPEAKEIALALELFTKGSLNTFAKPTNVETNNRLICYDIIDLGEQLMPIGMLVILDSILNRISRNRKKGKTTYIFIDEIYLLFKYEYTSRFIFELWKRIRKYGGCATGITQNVEELLRNDKARLMLANSELIIMLNQSATDRMELAKLLNISEMEMTYITNAGTGEGLIRVRNSLIPFRNKFPKNTRLYKLMTTKLEETIKEVV
ncbi:MAG: DUF87 domain-containing protein [Clostridia bacterium]|nr:DUF87 domain-containing protein [Clostridia bacterium]